jgi:hypothetical protein
MSVPDQVSAFRHVPIYRLDISVRNSPAEKEACDSEPLLSSLFLLCCGAYINRYPKKSNPLAGWLNACCSLEAAGHHRGILCRLSFSTNVSDPFNTSWPVSKRFTLAMGLALISGALKKAILIITN